jgi:NlpC/P60 family putative phage cell wall peptidase
MSANRPPEAASAALRDGRSDPDPKLSWKVSASPQGGGEGRLLTRTRIVAAARSWLGTPYRHQASAKGQGADCLGLLRGVYAELCGAEPEVPPPYTPDWNERRAREEPLLSAARRHLVEAPQSPLSRKRERGEGFLPGQVLIFRILTTGPAKHCGIAVSEDHFIHAYAGRAVVESWLTRWWIERLAGVFEFPGVEG